MSDESHPSRTTLPESATPPSGVAVGAAEPDDRLDVLRVLDAAMLSIDVDALDDRIDAGDVVVARAERTGSVVGALVATRPEPTRRHVSAVAVRRERRGRGIGSALVAAALERAEGDPRVDRMSAAFDADLTGFYTALGFDLGRDRDAGGYRDELDRSDHDGDGDDGDGGDDGNDGDGGDDGNDGDDGDDRLWATRPVGMPE